LVDADHADHAKYAVSRRVSPRSVIAPRRNPRLVSSAAK
jgi:hypothetical protein